jgi:hypothetical protein
MPVTPEAAGSSPVDPANYLQVNYLHVQIKVMTSGSQPEVERLGGTNPKSRAFSNTWDSAPPDKSASFS